MVMVSKAWNLNLNYMIEVCQIRQNVTDFSSVDFDKIKFRRRKIYSSFCRFFVEIDETVKTDKNDRLFLSLTFPVCVIRMSASTSRGINSSTFSCLLSAFEL